MTANKTIGEGMGTKRTWLLAMGALAVGLTTSLSAMAANVLQDVRYASAPGGKVDITLQFAEPVGDVQAFTTDTPPRIAVDIPNTTNGMSQRRVVIGSGATSAVSAVEADGRTRVVVDLFRPAAYTTRSAGNLLVLTVDAGAQQTNSLAGATDPTKRVASDIEVANIDFRRGENGSGRVVLRFNNDGATADMRNEGSRVVVDVANASIPENLRRRLDVTDFATPVQSLEPNANAGSTRLVINTNGAFESMAYQTGNEYVIEIAPKRGTVIAAATPARAAGAVAGQSAPQRYAGRPVTFNFQDVPVRTVLQLIAEESGLNIVASDTVSGNVTLRLINVPWDQAMEIVLRAKQLDQRRDGNVVWVAPQKEIADFEKAKADARIANEEREELVTEYIAINYGNAEEIARLLTEDSKSGTGGGSSGGQVTKGFLSNRGSVSFDNRTNTLLLIDTAKKVQEIRTLLATLDRPVDQVLIEARIVVASEQFARELGVIFGVQDRVGTLGAAAAAGETTTDSGFQVGLPVGTPAGLLNLSILRSDISLDLELSALEEEGRGEVVSNPRVITANQREAIIRQGDEVGYLTIQPATTPGAVATATVEFKEVLLELKVTPTITQDGRVYLNLMVKKDEVDTLIANPAGGFVPQISKREVSTAVLIDNGQTVVVGGVYEFSSREDLRKVPFLGDLPVLGNLFRNKSKASEKAELLIFVTPRILPVSRRG